MEKTMKSEMETEYIGGGYRRERRILNDYQHHVKVHVPHLIPQIYNAWQTNMSLAALAPSVPQRRTQN